MSTEARRAPIPPRPATPPPPSAPPRPTTPPRPADPPTADDAAQPLPDPNVPAADGAATAPPPPSASARFPDTPPTAGFAESAGSLRRETPGPAAPGATPPRRTGAPAETAAETTFRLRPIKADPPRESGNRPPGTPPQPGSGPAQGSAGLPRQSDSGPARRPAGTPPQPPTGSPQGAVGMPPKPPSHSGTPASAPLPPQRPMPEPSTAGGSAGRGYAAPADPSRGAERSTGGHGPNGFAPDPSFSWSAPMAPGGAPGAGRPVVSFGQPEGFGEQTRPRPLGVRIHPRLAAAAACVVLGVGLIGGAVTGSWLIGDSGDGDAQDTFAAAGSLWHSIPVDRLFPPTVTGQGAGPGGADRIWTRIAVAPDTGCANAFDPLLRKALAPVGCERLLRATYTDATRSYVTTVGLLFTTADSAAMRSFDTSFTKEGLDRRTDLMPRPYAAKGTLAAGFGDEQRASWTVSVLTDAPVVVYAVSGWADGRAVDEPEPAEEAMESGATTSVAQAGLGHEAKGLADRVERALRKNVGPSTEQSS